MNTKTSFYLFASVALIMLSHCDGAEIRHKRSDSTHACVPGTTWSSGCNHCFCSETGEAGCTLMACRREKPLPLFKEEDKGIAKRSVEEEVKECVPGTNWMMDCNRCFCTEGGVAACTAMGCFSLQTVQKETS